MGKIQKIKRNALISFAVILLVLLIGSGITWAATAVEYLWQEDPLNDVTQTDPSAIQPDMQAAGAQYINTTFYAGAMFPSATFSFEDFRFILYMDTDKNPNTGLHPSIGGNSLTSLGADFWINADSSGVSKVYQYGNPSPIGDAQCTFDTWTLDNEDFSVLIFQFPLSLIGDDGVMNYVIVASDNSGANYDIFPNQGVFSTNFTPEANAGEDQVVDSTGSTVELQGFAYDVETAVEDLTIQWNCISYPGATAPNLTGADTLTPSFMVSEGGVYILELMVSDGSNSASDTVTVSFNNVPPMADAQAIGTNLILDSVNLDGSGSNDANGDQLSYQWTWVSRPNKSTASITSATSAVASFIPDAVGTYEVQLVVDDGLLKSEPIIVTYAATATQNQAIEKARVVKKKIVALDPKKFKSSYMQRALSNKTEEIIGSIAKDNYQGAAQKTKKDIIKKVDGVPNPQDWVRDEDLLNAAIELYIVTDAMR
jgi:hypothetical protein